MLTFKDPVDQFPLTKVLRLHDLAWESYVDNLQFLLNLVHKLTKKSLEEDEFGVLIIAEYYQSFASSLFEFCEFEIEDPDETLQNNQQKYRQIIQIISKNIIQALKISETWSKLDRQILQKNVVKIEQNWKLEILGTFVFSTSATTSVVRK